jgi:hypothetical protein
LSPHSLPLSQAALSVTALGLLPSSGASDGAMQIFAPECYAVNHKLNYFDTVLNFAGTLTLVNEGFPQIKSAKADVVRRS